MSVTEAVLLLSYMRNFALIMEGLPSKSRQKDLAYSTWVVIEADLKDGLAELPIDIFNALKKHTKTRLIHVAKNLEEEGLKGLGAEAEAFFANVNSENWASVQKNFVHQLKRDKEKKEETVDCFSQFSQFVTKEIFQLFWEKSVSEKVKNLLEGKKKLISDKEAEILETESKAIGVRQCIEAAKASLNEEKSSIQGTGVEKKSNWNIPLPNYMKTGFGLFKKPEGKLSEDEKKLASREQELDAQEQAFEAQERALVDEENSLKQELLNLKGDLKTAEKNISYWESHLNALGDYEDAPLANKCNRISVIIKKKFEVLAEKSKLFEGLNKTFLAFEDTLKRNSVLREVKLTPNEIDDLQSLAITSVNSAGEKALPDLSYALGYLDKIAPVYKIFENLDGFFNLPFYLFNFIEVTYQQEDFKRVYKALSMVSLGFSSCASFLDERIKSQIDLLRKINKLKKTEESKEKNDRVIGESDMRKYLNALERYKKYLISYFQAPLRFVMALKEMASELGELIAQITELSPGHNRLNELKEGLSKLQKSIAFIELESQKLNQVKDVLVYLKKLIQEEGQLKNLMVAPDCKNPGDLKDNLSLIQGLKSLMNNWVSKYSRDASSWKIDTIKNDVTEVFSGNNYQSTGSTTANTSEADKLLEELYQKYCAKSKAQTPGLSS
ncbi:MAG: hypothetical protein JSS53_10135 [Proteobacteria bacterium]|nr:hypothetical protein [Pseudomonadota bacterium]